MPSRPDLLDYTLLTNENEESSVFSGRDAREAALKAARRLPPADSEEDVNESHVIRLRQGDSDYVYVFHGWAWKEPATEDSPDWVGETVTKAEVEKQRVEKL